MKPLLFSILKTLEKPISATPLTIFRLGFGGLMAFGTVRFVLLGWIEDHYTKPLFHFKYWGFEWIEPLSQEGLYAVHGLLFLASLGVMFAYGWAYRLSAMLLFLCFTYTELLDLTYYLNHYYFVSLTCFLLCLVSPPPVFGQKMEIPLWQILIFKIQIGIVYFFAGIAKMNYDWLILALPLKIWLPAHDKMPLIGEIFTWQITPYVFSWFGMIYDCTIVFFLAYRRTRLFAYITVIIFHTLTGLLFQIGIFPLVMMAGTLIFFDFNRKINISQRNVNSFYLPTRRLKPTLHFFFLFSFFLFQILFPFRYLLYKGNLFWTEEGYRFSWRVMLMEKAGTALFYVKDTQTGREGVVDNADFLNLHQEKQMAMQPDMILQFAHFLGKFYAKQGISDPEVRAEVYVTLNGRPSRLLIDPNRNLMKEKDTFAPKNWILHYEND